MSNERRGRDGGEPQQAQIDLESIVGRVVGGDEGAAVELDKYLRQRFARYFARRLPGQAEDLTQDTLMDISVALPNFDPTIGKGDFSQNFTNWSYAIARSNLNMELRRTLGNQARPFSEVTMTGGRSMNEYASDVGIRDQREELPEIKPQDLMPEFREKLSGLLAPGQLEVVELRMDGKSIDEIVTLLGSTRRAVLNRFMRAREKIEGEIFYPAGFRRLADYEDGALNQAAGGNLEAVNFLGLYYVKDEWVQRYQPRRMLADESLVGTGFLLLSETTTPEEYGTLMGGTRYKSLLTRHQGRVYITADGLDTFRKARRRAVKRFDSPGEDYQLLRGFASSIAEASRLLIAANNGELPAVKKGNWWFVRPADANRFLRVQKPQRSAVPRVVTTESVRDIVRYETSSLEEMPESDSDGAFREWFFKTAKVVSDRRLPWNKRRQLSQPDNQIEATNIFLGQLEEWMRIRDITLNSQYMEVVRERASGQKVSDVAKELGWAGGSAGGVLAKARKAIEGKLLFPAGIKRVVDYGDGTLSGAAIAGRLEAVWFLGKWYTTDEIAKNYKKK